MGEKFPAETQTALRGRVDLMEHELTKADPGLVEFAGKNSIGPLFVGLADHCVEQPEGALTMINPTIALTNPSGLQQRLALAQRFHIHTVLTSHQPQNINLSQHTSINESIVVMRRHAGNKPPTRFINLDRLPVDDGEVADFHRCLLDCEGGLMADGWGEVSYWPAERIEAGDWTAAIWRSPELAKASIQYASHPDLLAIKDLPDYIVRQSGRRVSENMERASQFDAGSIPILYGKGAEAQTTIEGQPDEYWIAQKGRESQTEHYLKWKSHLLITEGQRNNTARLTAVAANKKYIGAGWHPITGMYPEEAKATAVFINSTPGRLQVMRNAGRTIEFPIYRPAGIDNVRIPDIKDDRIRGILAACWERTKDMVVPQFQDGECKVRRLWDEAVAEAMGWDAAELTRLRMLLHQEPHVRGLGYGQYADEVGSEPADRQRFTELADQWEIETVFESNTAHAVEHPAHKEIISMGEPVVPLILERMRKTQEGGFVAGGHWDNALGKITGVNPVRRSDWGNIAAIHASWLEWGEANGYI